MSNVTDVTDEERTAANRASIRRRILNLRNQKVNLTKDVQDLTALVADDEVAANFGAEIGDVRAAVADLAK